MVKSMRNFTLLASLFLLLLVHADLRADIPPPYERHGIGARLQEGDPYPTFTEVRKGGAAANAGIVVGDAVIAIDGDYARGGVPFYYFAGKLSGREGTEVDLVLLHGAREVKVVKVKRLHKN
jgi:C-terminal processing protease CtpA/Prc